MGIFLKRGKYFIDYRVKGRRKRECVGTSRRMAEKALAVRQAEIIQDRYQIRKKEYTRFSDFAEVYLQYARVNKRSWERDQTLLNNLMPSFGHRNLDEITPFLIEAHKQQRVARVKPATVNREIALLKHMFNMAIRWEKAEKNPMRDVRMFREEEFQYRVLTPDEIERLLAACTERYSRPIVLTALHTGMRLNEILSLKWDQVDLENGLITVYHTKNGKVRRIPINEALMGMFSAMLRKADSEYVFTYYKTKKPVVVFRTAWLNALDRSGIGRCRFHDLRHTFASYLVAAGVDLMTVKEILGHSTIVMTSRYAHSAPEHKRRAVSVMAAKLGPESGHQVDTKALLGQNGQNGEIIQLIGYDKVEPKRKRGRVVEGGGLENRSAARHQGFESSRFRQ